MTHYPIAFPNPERFQNSIHVECPSCDSPVPGIRMAPRNGIDCLFGGHSRAWQAIELQTHGEGPQARDQAGAFPSSRKEYANGTWADCIHRMTTDARRCPQTLTDETSEAIDLERWEARPFALRLKEWAARLWECWL